jgi:hypothetical protein
VNEPGRDPWRLPSIARFGTQLRELEDAERGYRPYAGGDGPPLGDWQSPPEDANGETQSKAP